MKYLRLALTLLALTPAAMRADNADSSDQDSEEQQKPPTEIPDFNNLDEYVYVPKSTLNFGWRVIGGTKVKFTGSASILSYSPVPDLTNQNVSRTYADGSVYSDTRTVVSENGDGTAVSFPITPDGKTNTWTYTNTSQVLPSGFIQFHIYTADTTASEFNASGKTNTGLEVSVAHDYKDFGKHWSLKLFGGFSVNDISAYSMGTLNAVLNTTTDTYDLYGVTPPPATPAIPYNSAAGTGGTQDVFDANGNPEYDANGNPITELVDTNILISNSPLNRLTSSGPTTVTNTYKVHGAYSTFRGGPQLVYNFNDHLHLAVSAGPALVFAGSSYTVNSTLTPPTGDSVVETLVNTTSKGLIGYYADATMQYNLTETAGFYLGASTQFTGTYNQTAALAGAGSYTTSVDLNSLAGVRAGMAVKF